MQPSTFLRTHLLLLINALPSKRTTPPHSFVNDWKHSCNALTSSRVSTVPSLRHISYCSVGSCCNKLSYHYPIHQYGIKLHKGTQRRLEGTKVRAVFQEWGECFVAHLLDWLSHRQRSLCGYLSTCPQSGGPHFYLCSSKFLLCSCPLHNLMDIKSTYLSLSHTCRHTVSRQCTSLKEPQSGWFFFNTCLRTIKHRWLGDLSCQLSPLNSSGLVKSELIVFLMTRFPSHPSQFTNPLMACLQPSFFKVWSYLWGIYVAQGQHQQTLFISCVLVQSGRLKYEKEQLYAV